MAKTIPVRQCTGCREAKPKNELLRIVRSSDGNIVLDTKGKLSGRGAYICRNRECFEKALRSKALERSLSTAIPADLYESITQLFENQKNG